MADNNKTFTLVGAFDDKISPKLREINKLIEQLGKSFSVNTKIFNEQSKELEKLSKSFNALSKNLENVSSSATKTAQSLHKVGETESSVRKPARGLDEVTGSARKANDESERLLNTLVKFESIRLVGEGFANGLAEGAQKTIGLLEKGMSFIGERFSEGVKDQLGDIMARGSLYGSLTKEGMFGQAPSGLSKDQMIDRSDALYSQTKNISRAMDNSINDIIRTSTASSETIQVLSRQLGDNLLPVMLKEKGIMDLSTVSRQKLNEVMGGENGVGKQLATLYSQIASVIPSPAYAPMAARGLTQFLGSGTINKQLALFEQNPVLVSALQDGLKKFGNTVSGRIKAAAYGFEIAMPQAALDEAKNSIAGGLQSVHDTLLGPSGILTFTADQGEKQSQKTLAMMKKNGVYDKLIADLKEQDKKRLEAYKKSGKSEIEVQAYRSEQLIAEKRYAKRLTEFYTSADSPIEVISTVIGPLLQEFADMLNSAGNLFIGPVNEIVGSMAPALTQLKLNFRNLGSDIRGNKRSLAEALGRAIGEIFKNIAMLFDPKGLGKKANSAIDKFFADFKKGFESINGQKYVDMVMKGIGDMIMRLLFNQGNVFKGFTPLGDLLKNVFLIMSTGPVLLGVASALGVILTNGFVKFGENVIKNMGKSVSSRMAANAYNIPIGPVPAGEALGIGATEAAPMSSFGALLRGVLAPLARLTLVLAGVTAAVVMLGGGVKGTTRQLSDFFGETWNSFSGAFGGLVEVFGVLFDIVGDGGRALGEFIGSVTGIKGGFDGLKIALDPITLTLQATEMGLRGLATLLANIRVWFAEHFGTEKEKKEARKQALQQQINEGTARGRINAYNASQLGPAEIARQRADALKTMRTESNPTALRAAELVTFLKETEKYLKTNPVPGSGPTLSTTGAAARAAEAEQNKKALALYTEAAKGATSSQVDNTRQLSAAQKAQVVVQNKITAGWSSTIVTSQDRLSNSASALSTSLNSAAAKISTASGIPLTPQSAAGPGAMVKGAYSGHLGTNFMKAVAQEQKNMPSGANLVVANSSETIIPAANGLNLGSLAMGMDKFTAGANAVGEMAAQMSSMMGGGAISGNLIEVGKMLLARGLQVGMNSFFQYGIGFLPGGGGYIGKHSPHSLHYANRALDVIGTNAQLDAAYAALRGSNPTELFWRMPGHYDHLHVAYARGLGNPTYFPSQSDAMMWEQKMMPPGAQVRSITSNSSENLGGTTTVNAPITIHQQPGQDAEQLASIVAMRLSEAIMQSRASAIQY